MSVTDLLQWWNLIYALPLALSVLWIVSTALAGGHGHGQGHAHGHGGGHSVSHALHHAGDRIHAQLHAHAHTSVAHDGAHAHASHASHDGHAQHHDGESSSGASKFMMVLGLDEAPLSLMVAMFLLCWGSFGLLANKLFGVLHYPSLFIWPSMAVAFVVSATVTRAIAEIVGRIMPRDETFGVSLLELVGSLGRSVFTVSETTGTIDIKDHSGTVHRVQAKSEDANESIAAGTEVIVVDYDDEDKRFIVRKSDI